MKIREIIAWGVVVFLLFISRCNPAPTAEPVSGHFSVTRPEPIEIPNVPTVRFVILTDTVTVTAFIEPTLQESINNSGSLTEALEHCLEAVKMRQYKDTFEDDHIRIDYFARTWGKLDSLDLKYELKPRRIQRLQVYGGLEFNKSLRPQLIGIVNERVSVSVSSGFTGSNPAVGVGVKLF